MWKALSLKLGVDRNVSLRSSPCGRNLTFLISFFLVLSASFVPSPLHYIKWHGHDQLIKLFTVFFFFFWMIRLILFGPDTAFVDEHEISSNLVTCHFQGHCCICCIYTYLYPDIFFPCFPLAGGGGEGLITWPNFFLTQLVLVLTPRQWHRVTLVVYIGRNLFIRFLSFVTSCIL